MHARVERSNNNSNEGFTLIEILITIAIIGIIIAFAVFAVGDFGQSRRIKSAAEELDLLIGLVQEQAVLEPAVFGINIQPKGYGFFEFVLKDRKTGGKWESLAHDEVLFNHTFPSQMSVSIKPLRNDFNLAAPATSQLPQIIISPNGNMTPFIIDMGKVNSAPSIRIIGQYNGELTLTELR